MLIKQTIETLTEKIFRIRSEKDFNKAALEAFGLHIVHNPVYRDFVGNIYPDLGPESLSDYHQIPFLPIELFKTRKIYLAGNEPETYFMSSGTVSQGAVHSRHYIADLSLYQRCFTEGFRHFWGEPSDYAILALLPNYMEQPHSSLICMMKELIRLSAHPRSGFYLNETDRLASALKDLETARQNTMLWGVSYALLDLAETHPMALQHVKILETGGMKGRRKEMVKEELYGILRKAFHVPKIFSEYGMCELLSQAYASGQENRFLCPPWMKVLIRQAQDPLSLENGDKTGGVNIIDLGNLHSCPFIATQDLGKINRDGSFSVLGRFDTSDIRGCNLLIQ